MKNLFILSNALDYIESNLCETITQEDIANACFTSLSSVQKLFRYAFHLSLKEYITKRRLTHAAKDIIESDMTITDVAMKYQYNSPEVFTRAFSKLWGTSPSTFKNKWKFTGIFPKIIFDYQGGNIMSRKKVDISELYDVLKENQNTYVICFDIVGLMPINDISHEAGDKAILECLKRIDDVANENMLLFRIGGDEFALVTGLDCEKEVECLAKKVLNLNRTPIFITDHEIPVSMRAGATRFTSKTLKYNELFNNLHNTIESIKEFNMDVVTII